jgi:hypothetical protein
MGKDIDSSRLQPPAWDGSKPMESLRALRAYAESQAQGAAEWYYRGKKRKRRLSVTGRFLTIVLTALGGLIPVAAAIFFGSAAQELERLRFNQWGYLAIGLAGLALGFDRFYGGSSGWMRYITTALAIESLLEEFRLDWAKLESELAAQPNDPGLVGSAIDRIKAFVLAVRARVENETQAWVSEFRSTMTQLEKQTEEALNAAREEARKDLEAQISARKAAVDAERPGAIEISVTSPALKEGYSVEVDGRRVKSRVTGKTCGVGEIAQGIHEVAVYGIDTNGTTKRASRVIQVAPKAVAQVAIDLT